MFIALPIRTGLCQRFSSEDLFHKMKFQKLNIVKKESIEEVEGDRRLKKSRYAETFAHKLLQSDTCNLQST